MDPLPRLLTDVLPALVEGVGLHHRPPAAAVGVVVYLPLLIQCVVPDLVALDADVAPLLPPAQDGFAQHVPHHVGEQGHDIDTVHSQSLSSLGVLSP